jgi:hypothetical protein
LQLQHTRPQHQTPTPDPNTKPQHQTVKAKARLAATSRLSKRAIVQAIME